MRRRKRGKLSAFSAGIVQRYLQGTGLRYLCTGKINAPREESPIKTAMTTSGTATTPQHETVRRDNTSDVTDTVNGENESRTDGAEGSRAGHAVQAAGHLPYGHILITSMSPRRKRKLPMPSQSERPTCLNYDVQSPRWHMKQQERSRHTWKERPGRKQKTVSVLTTPTAQKSTQLLT